jgi:hypothetical protein
MFIEKDQSIISYYQENFMTFHEAINACVINFFNKYIRMSLCTSKIVIKGLIVFYQTSFKCNKQ